MKAKYRYSVDKSNRLIIRHEQKRVVPDGNFSVDSNNRLIYWLNEPASWRREYDLPNKIRFQGNWKLNPNYDLELILNETKDQFKGDRLVLKGEIISTDKDTLIFEIIAREQGLSLSELSRSRFKGTAPESTHIYLLKLAGSWQADEYNRLQFIVKKKIAPDILTLEGSWQLNKNQQITYTYEKIVLKTKTKVSNTLTFEGFWQINSANKLTYILSRSSESRFDFRVQIESPNLYPQEGVIKYRLGIGLKGLSPPERLTKSPKGTIPKIITLYGTWKFSRKFGLIFQMDYGKGQVQGIEFGTDISLTQRNKISFMLKNKTGERLGINIAFTHRFLKQMDAEVFLRLKETLKRESGIEAGLRIPF